MGGTRLQRQCIATDRALHEIPSDGLVDLGFLRAFRYASTQAQPKYFGTCQLTIPKRKIRILSNPSAEVSISQSWYSLSRHYIQKPTESNVWVFGC